MRKSLILLTMLWGSLITVNAQTPLKSYIGISAGLSTPTGNFSKSDYGQIYHENNKAGYAKNGVTIGIDGAWYFHKNLAVAGNISYQDQGGLNKKDVENLAAGYTDGFAVDNSTVTANKRYNSLNALIGPQYSFVFNKLILDIRIVGGVIKSLSTPETRVDLEDDPSHTFYQRSSKSTAFAYGAGLGLRYNFNKKLGLALRGNYIYSDGIKIKNENRNINAGRLVKKQPISLIQTTLGLTWSL